jgi:hypothetical protein
MHQENLCAKTHKMTDAVTLVSKPVNFVTSKGMNLYFFFISWTTKIRVWRYLLLFGSPLIESWPDDYTRAV